MLKLQCMQMIFFFLSGEGGEGPDIYFHNILQLLPGFSSYTVHTCHLLSIMGHISLRFLLLRCALHCSSLVLFIQPLLICPVRSVLFLALPPSWRSTNVNSTELNIPCRTPCFIPERRLNSTRYVMACLASVRTIYARLIKTSLKTVSRIRGHADLTNCPERYAANAASYFLLFFY